MSKSVFLLEFVPVGMRNLPKKKKSQLKVIDQLMVYGPICDYVSTMFLLNDFYHNNKSFSKSCARVPFLQ